MPKIVTTIHNAEILAKTCRQFGLVAPQRRTLSLEGEEVYGWVVRLPGLRFAIVCDTLTGLVSYHPCDSSHQRYAHLMQFIHLYYAVQGRLRYEVPRLVCRQGRRARTKKSA